MLTITHSLTQWLSEWLPSLLERLVTLNRVNFDNFLWTVYPNNCDFSFNYNTMLVGGAPHWDCTGLWRRNWCIRVAFCIGRSSFIPSHHCRMHDFYQSGRDRGHKEQDIWLKVTTVVNGRGGYKTSSRGNSHKTVNQLVPIGICLILSFKLGCNLL